MTTFTMQDLNNMPTTPEEDEAMEALAKLGAGVTDFKVPVLNISDGGRTVHYQDAPTTQDTLANMAIPRAPEPQPTSVGTNVPDLALVLQTIAEQFSLLATVISQQGGGMGNSQAEDQSLQECVEMVLRQGAWFDDKVADAIDEDVISDAVKDHVETEVEYYFSNGFDPSDHFDFHDAVSDAVDDRLDDIVRDRLDDVVNEQLEELVAEKLQNIKISFE